MKQKPQVYVLHGWTYQVDKWQPFIKQLSKKYRVKLLKIPGLTDPLNEVWCLEDYVSWLDSQLPKHTQVVLMGHSNGGRISMAYTLSHPKKVQKLILIDSAGIRDKSVLLQIKRSVFEVIAKLGKIFVPSDKARRILYRLAGETDYYQANPILGETMANLIKVDLQPKLSLIMTPTLIIWGENDSITPLKQAYTFHQSLPNSRLEIISQARHSPMYSHPQKVVSLINQYLQTDI